MNYNKGIMSYYIFLYASFSYFFLRCINWNEGIYIYEEKKHSLTLEEFQINFPYILFIYI